MELLTDDAIDPAPLHGKRVTIVGYGNQGRAQALNLRDSGIDVTIGLREGSARWSQAAKDGLAVAPLADCTTESDLVMLLAPDEVLAALYRDLAPRIAEGAALGFSHGLALRFEFIVPRPDLDVFMVAPKGPGSALRSLYERGRGMVALWSVAQDATGKAKDLALAYGRAIGCGRAGLIETTIAEECEADLFNEQAVVWGAVPELLIAGFDTLVAGGISEEVAYMECVGELKLLAELVEARGIAGMREAISNTAELGAVMGGPRLIDDPIRARMADIFAEIRSGAFADALRQEEAEGYPKLRHARQVASARRVERAFRSLKGLRS